MGTKELYAQVKQDLMQEEGFRQWAYPDPFSPLARQHPHLPWGKVPARPLMSAIGGVNDADGVPWTVGYGFTNGVNPDSNIPQIQAERKLEGLIQDMDGVLTNALSWYKDATEVTRGVLINMAFNMGVKGLLGFKNSLGLLKIKDYAHAAQNLQLSLWYKETGNRAKTLVQRIATQTIEPQTNKE